MLERGDIAGFRLHARAVWQIDEEDVIAHETSLLEVLNGVRERADSQRLKERKKSLTSGRNASK
jgi:hypothetical protein